MSDYSSIPVPPDASRGWLTHLDGSRVTAERWSESPVGEPPLVGSRHLGETFYQQTWLALGWGWEADS